MDLGDKYSNMQRLEEPFVAVKSLKMRDANSDEVKFCGSSKFDGVFMMWKGRMRKVRWNLCPNRFEYITRPEVLHDAFSS